MTAIQMLRERLRRATILAAPGAPDALSTRLVAAAGFEAVYMTGLGATASRLGMPDLGLMTQTEMAEHARAMCRAVETPVIADADTGLPVTAMDDFADACRARLRAELPDMLSLYYGHIADGNLHIVALSRGATTQPMSEISGIVYDTVRDFGGTVSAEHGIGLLKKKYLGYTRSPKELALMARLKAALDLAGLLNPGKVFDMPAGGSL